MTPAPYALMLLAAVALAAPGATLAQVQTQPLPDAGAPAPRADHSARQTGLRVLHDPDGREVVVRSFEPQRQTGTDYRISFEALDANGDGVIDRTEARAHPLLDAEFRAVDTDGDGRLSRQELRGWIR